MIIVKASCYDCGEVEPVVSTIQLRVCTRPDLSTYSFACPNCGAQVVKPADDHVVSLLVSGGIRAEVWQVPAEALEPKPGPGLTYDDLLDFALHLGTTDLLSAAAIGEVQA